MTFPLQSSFCEPLTSVSPDLQHEEKIILREMENPSFK